MAESLGLESLICRETCLLVLLDCAENFPSSCLCQDTRTAETQVLSQGTVMPCEVLITIRISAAGKAGLAPSGTGRDGTLLGVLLAAHRCARNEVDRSVKEEVG